MIDLIIPAYNAHDTLPQLLHSIAMQTLDVPLKIILVDDCSDKNYNEIVNVFSPFLTIEEIRMERNGGPGFARKLGLSKCESDYVCFADADDVFLTHSALQILYDSIKKKRSHLVSASFLEEYIPNQVARHEDDLVWVFAKIYDRRFLESKQITFNNTRANEDTGFNLLIKLCTDRISYVHSDVYLWRYHPNAITKRNDKSYTYNESMFGIVENRTWAILEAEKRGSFEERIIEAVIDSLFLFYGNYNTLLEHNKSRAEEFLSAVAVFYKEVYSYYEPNITQEMLETRWAEIYNRYDVLKRIQAFLPKETISGFLEKIKF